MRTATIAAAIILALSLTAVLAARSSPMEIVSRGDGGGWSADPTDGCIGLDEHETWNAYGTVGSFTGTTLEPDCSARTIIVEVRWKGHSPLQVELNHLVATEPVRERNQNLLRLCWNGLASGHQWVTLTSSSGKPVRGVWLSVADYTGWTVDGQPLLC